MPGRQAKWIYLSASERATLQQLVANRESNPRAARRAEILLAMSDRATCVKDLAAHSKLTRSAVWRLCRRFDERGLGVLVNPIFGRPKARPVTTEMS